MSARGSESSSGVTDEWLDDHLASVFARWHSHVAPTQTTTEESVIAEAGIRPGFEVLDVASGSGVPALRLAEIVGPGGRIVATDPNPIFIEALTANARARKLTNLDVVQASAESLPFPPASFDAITCHMGVMFFADLDAGLQHIRTLLRPGGRAAFVAWGPHTEVALFSTFGKVIGSYLPAPAPPPADEPAADSIPGPQRFATPGSLSRALATSGFGDVRERSEQVDLVWPDAPDSIVDFQLELSRILQRVPAARHDDLRSDLKNAFAHYQDGDSVRLPAHIIVASGAA